MAERELHVVTGAFGYSGKRIATRLLNEGRRVRTLTNSPHRANPFDGIIEAHPFNFDDPAKLTESLRGATVLYNTYWIRHGHTGVPLWTAVDNTLRLFAAAEQAGVERVVHVSITNPDEASPLEYFRGKARLEQALTHSQLSYAILRPALLFGSEDILVNNIAWALRYFPVIGMFGDGQYRMRPIHVDDLAALAVEQGKKRENCILDAVGPETFTYREFIETVARIIGKEPRIMALPVPLAYFFTWIVGKFVGDVMITRDEITGLMAEKLYTTGPATGPTKLTEWAKEHAATLGFRYASELARRRNRRTAYEKL
jgi:NADH dehydrogenase